MEKLLGKGDIWRVSETTVLDRLVLEADSAVLPPEGKLLTLTVDGVHRDLAPGSYQGDVVLSVTEPVRCGVENHGQMEWFQMNAAVSVRDGKYCPAESVQAAVLAGQAADGAAQGLKLRSEGDNFGGIYVDGDGSYAISDVDIALNGNGGSDAVGYGAAIAVRGNAHVTNTCYLNELTISEDSSVAAAMTVDGVETVPAPGTYTGKIVLKP